MSKHGEHARIERSGREPVKVLEIGAGTIATMQPSAWILLAVLVRASAAQEPPVALPSEPAEVERKGLVVRTSAAFEGYTLYAPLRSKSTYLIDLGGQVVHTWQSAHPPGNSVYLLDDGTLLRCAREGDNAVFYGGGIGGRVQRLAWDGTVLWDYLFADEERMHHHDIAPLPTGNVLLIAWERLSAAEAISLGRDPEQVGEQGLWSDAVFEVRPMGFDGGEIVWEWHAWDHLVQDLDPDLGNYGSAKDRPERLDINADHRDEPPASAAELEQAREREREMRAAGYAGGDEEQEEDDTGEGRAERRRHPDWLHTNSIDYDAEHDWILLSTPRLNEIWILDHSTTVEEAAGSSGGRHGKGGDLLYRWGNPRTYGAGTRAGRQLFAQHDAHWIQDGLPGAGHVLLFNNGTRRPEGEYSSVDELVLPFTPERGFARDSGAAFGPQEPIWSYRAAEPASFYSFFISGAQRLPNGDTLICSGAQGRLFEVSAGGEIVWEYHNPHGGDVAPSMGRAGGGAGAGPRDGPPREDAPPGGPPARGPGAGRGLDPHALFRATRLAVDHPGLAALRSTQTGR